METILNRQGIRESIRFIQNQQQQLRELKQQLINILNSEELNDGSLNREMQIVLNALLKEIEETRMKINEMRQCIGDKDDVDQMHDDLLTEVIEMKREKYTQKVYEIHSSMSNPFESERSFKYEKYLDPDECNQLEKWTEKKCGEKLFDSDNDDWSQGTSVFKSKLIGKENIALIISDGKHNVFGVYVNNEICPGYCNRTSTKSFAFSLKSNGRLNGMRRFMFYSRCQVMNTYLEDNELLFTICSVFHVFKKNVEKESWCFRATKYGTCCDFQGFEFPLTGESSFIPKKIVAIQMI